jgi:hypothetical protein
LLLRDGRRSNLCGFDGPARRQSADYVTERRTTGSLSWPNA